MTDFIDALGSLLDRGRERGYQHRLTMIGAWDDNCGLFRPTRASLSHLPPSKIPVRLLLNEVGFPAELGSMAQPVEALWYVGRLPDAAARRLAIVGARDASMAKSRLAHDLSVSAVRNLQAATNATTLCQS